ncbi:hypothetical protein AB0K60_28230 [Thermopolyspora sp. NPDC052614]|uniref:hypothetical protein n=1 Tax=Thermopolyspora sp. NPDC052614 TaxID=3155682 RepID=UPI00342517F4
MYAAGVLYQAVHRVWIPVAVLVGYSFGPSVGFPTAGTSDGGTAFFRRNRFPVA